MDSKQPEYLSPAQVVARWENAVTTGTLANWRAQKKGPPYRKMGGRVRYPLAKLVEWEAKNEHANDNTQAAEAAA